MASRVRTKLTEVLKGLLERVVMLIRLILVAVMGAVICVLAFVLGMAAPVAGSVAVFLLLDWCVGPVVAMFGATITFSVLVKMVEWLCD
jgi:hypothetical protein